MKRLFLSVLFVTLCAGLAQAETTTVWAKGVSAEGGWYDVNKQGPNDDNDGDKNMCYAASAANLITWWQDSLTVVPTGTPTDAESVWTAYKNASNSNGMNGGDAGWAMAWWVSGVYSPTSKSEADRWITSNIALSSYSELQAFSGYYYHQCDLTNNEVKDFVGAYLQGNYWVSSYTLNGDSISGGLFQNKTFGDVLRAGYGISLGLRQDSSSGFAHAITLWGVDYDSEGNLTRLWLTDSDDLQYGLNEDGLFAADVKIKNGKVYLSTQPVTWQEGNTIYSQTWYPEDEGTYIGSVCLLNPAAFTLVPEPTTASLSLMALVGLVARRRRK